MPADFDISPIIPPVQHHSPAGGPAPVMPVAPPTVPPAGFTPAMPKKINANRILKWLILIAVGLFIITIGSLWWGGNSFSDKGVLLSIEGPESTVSGNEVKFTVTYENTTGVSLSRMSFRIFYPSGSIVLKDGRPTTPESEGFMVESLDPGKSDTKEFVFFMVGDKGAIKSTRVHLIYTAGSLKSSFEKEAAASTTITTLPVGMTLVAPPTSVVGQPIQYILDVRNDTESDLADLKAIFKYPDGFVVQKMQPNPDTGNTEWDIEQLKVGAGKRITVTGTLQGNEQETKTVDVVLRRKLNGEYVDYVRSQAFTVISSPLLSVSVSPNGSRDYVSFAGDSLTYTISYTNNSRFTLLGLLLGVKLEGDMYEYTQLKTNSGFFDDATKTVAYDSSGVPDLAALRPGQSGRVTFSVPLKPGFSGASGAKTFFVKATARIATSNVPSGIEGDEVFALDSVVTKISSQPSFAQALLYDNGSGSGPLPPQIGQETTLTVRWQLVNPGNDVRNTKITATLPPGVTFKNATTTTIATAPVFDLTTNTVTWNVGTLPYGTGNGLPKYQATFQVSIRPSANQQGQSVQLVSGATMNGTDSFTSQPHQVKLGNATTSDIENHPDDGRVQ